MLILTAAEFGNSAERTMDGVNALIKRWKDIQDYFTGIRV